MSPSYSTVKNWFNEFNRGRWLLKSEVRQGRPKTAVVPKNIDAMHELIMQDRQLTYRDIGIDLYCLGISPTSKHSIFHEHLAVKKIYSPWIPQNLTIAQKRARANCWKC